MLNSKVLIEKSGINKNVVIQKPKMIKMVKIKRNISILISTFVSILFSYLTLSLADFNNNILSWSIIERFIFLIITPIGSILIYIYCRFQLSENENFRGQDEYITIGFLSTNWFKKLFSIFVFYFFVTLILALIASFCAMSIDINKMGFSNRVTLVTISYIGTMLMCCLAHNNNLKFFVKLEE